MNQKAKPIDDLKEIPANLSNEEQIEFLETHGVSEEFLNNTEEVSEDERPRPRQRTRPINVRFDDFMLGRLKELAKRRNVGYQTLLKEFVAERLYEEEKRGRGILDVEERAVPRILGSENEQRGEMSRRRRPRHFLYLDSGLAESYLSDLVGPLPEEASSTKRFLESKRRDSSVGYRGTGYSRGSGEEDSFEDTERLRYTPQTLFKGLYDELDREEDGEKILISLQSLDEVGWNELQDGDFVEVTGTVKIPEIIKAIGAAHELDRLFSLIEPLSETFGQDLGVDQEQRQVMSSIGKLKELSDSPESQNAAVVVIELSKTPRYRFVAKLKRECLRMSLEDLEGEVKVLGTVIRKINEGDPPIGFEQLVPGLEALRGVQDLSSRPAANRAKRRAKGKRGQSQPSDGMSIGYPAATFIPIGIYR